jgi:hypothetical protein
VLRNRLRRWRFISRPLLARLATHNMEPLLVIQDILDEDICINP